MGMGKMLVETIMCIEREERRLEDFHPFAIFLDTIHRWRGGEAFIIAFGINMHGAKRPLGF